MAEALALGIAFDERYVDLAAKKHPSSEPAGRPGSAGHPRSKLLPSVHMGIQCGAGVESDGAKPLCLQAQWMASSEVHLGTSAWSCKNVCRLHQVAVQHLRRAETTLVALTGVVPQCDAGMLQKLKPFDVGVAAVVDAAVLGSPIAGPSGQGPLATAQAAFEEMVEPGKGPEYKSRVRLLWPGNGETADTALSYPLQLAPHKSRALRGLYFEDSSQRCAHYGHEATCHFWID